MISYRSLLLSTIVLNDSSPANNLACYLLAEQLHAGYSPEVIYNNIDYQSSQEIINYGFHLEMIHYNLRLIAVLKRLFKTHIIKVLLS